MKEWYSVKELEGLTKLPSTARRITDKAKREQWQARPRQGRGGGFEYHINSLPPKARITLIQQQKQQVVDIPIPESIRAKEINRDELMDAWDNATNDQRQKAQERLNIINQMLMYMKVGLTRQAAIEQLHKEGITSVTPTTIQRWHNDVKKHDKREWPLLLLPKHHGLNKGERIAECHQEAWLFLLALFLRAEKPSKNLCIYETELAAEEHGWSIPSKRTMQRWLREKIAFEDKIYFREGMHKIRALYPPQKRTVMDGDMHAMHTINGDGYTHNLFIQISENEKPIRVKTWFWQDVYTRKILGYRVSTSENTEQIRLSFAQVIQTYGVPKHVVIDNTRSAANKTMSGGVKSRKRHKQTDDEPLGIFPRLGVEVTFTGIYNDGYTSKGNGGAKPIERAFGIGGFGEFIDKHPRFSGAYTGSSPQNKPFNYGSHAVPIEEFEEVLQQRIIQWNQKQGRQTEACKVLGLQSFDEVFNYSYARSKIIRASQQQLDSCLLASEAVKAKTDGTVELNAGSYYGEIKKNKNSYYSPHLRAFGAFGEKVVVCYDPEYLHDEVSVYSKDGAFICKAECVTAAGFHSVDSAREHNRARSNMVKHQKAEAEALDRMTYQEMIAHMTVPDSDKVAELPKPAATQIMQAKHIVTTTEQEIKQNEAKVLQLEQLVKKQAEPKQKDKYDLKNLTADESYNLWLELDETLTNGGAIPEKIKRFYDYYPETVEFKSRHAMAQLEREFEKQHGNAASQ